MAVKKKPEVLVVGAGPVGLTAALVLARRGVSVLVVDRDWRTGAHSYALALHARSLAVLEELGLAETVVRQAYRVHAMQLHDATGLKAEVPLAAGAEDPAAVAVLRQDALERVLERALRAEGVEVLWNHEVVRLVPGDDGVQATIDRLEKDSVGYATAHTEWIVARSFDLRVPLVIGADGHRSLVRRRMGIEFAEVAPAEHFAVFEFRGGGDLGGRMHVVLGDDATSAVWPLPGGCCRWSFQLTDFEAPLATRTKDRVAVQLGRQQFPVLGGENLRALLAQRAPWFEGQPGPIDWRIVVCFEHRLANSFGGGRVWLAGDAAHTTGPVGVQSMNVGLREADELAGLMAGILQDGRPLDDLEGYGKRRDQEWRALLGQQGGFQAAAATDPWIAENARRILSCIPASGDELTQAAGQLGLGQV